MKIYHNPRCGKSKQTLILLQERVENIEIIEYLKDDLSVIELEEIIEILGIKPIDLVRKKEQIWIENYKNKNLSSNEIVKVMVENPKIIERPIVVKGKNAIIGRPPENVLSLLL